MTEDDVATEARLEIVKCVLKIFKREGTRVELEPDLEKYLRDHGLWDETIMVPATKHPLI